jgi:hypothetical protein
MKGSAGGKVMAVRQRDLAIAKYYENPNVCLQCSAIIKVLEGQKVSEVKEKKFCNCKCSTTYNNKFKRKVKVVVPAVCKGCHNSIVPNRRHLCNGCKQTAFGARTKGELFGVRRNWQSARSSIRYHASLIFDFSGKEKSCVVCKYDKHIQISHIRPVSDFPPDAKVSEINEINNLVPLCPNHHWEFDHGLLKLTDVSGTFIGRDSAAR